MKKVMWLVISALSLSLTVVATDALAKRAGSGGNAGMQRSVTPAAPASSPASAAAKPAAQPGSAAAPAAAGAATGAATAAAAKSSWMAPLMAFAAGGLLAAAFMGGGFDGISGMDILVLLLLVAGAYFFLRRRAANMAQQAAGQPSPAAGGYARESSAPTAGGGLRDVVMGSRVGDMDMASAAPATSATLAAPAWFDEASFTQQAKDWYVRLQAAWDTKDFGFLSAITTPTLLEEFKALRAQQSDTNQTRVDEVHVQVVAWDKEQDQWVLTVRFSGFIAEEAGAFPHAFAEYWHLLRTGEADGEWRLAGIQQA